jgi:hypothetical protein
MHFEYQTPCTMSKVSWIFYFNFVGIGDFIWIPSMLITSYFCMYNYNTVSGEASHSNRSCYASF